MANSVEDMKQFVIRWNMKYPFDRYYRKKHGIGFLSEEHKRTSFFAEMMEYIEDVTYASLKRNDENDNSLDYIPNIGEWLKSDFEAGYGEQEFTSNDISMFREEMWKRIEEESGDTEEKEEDK